MIGGVPSPSPSPSPSPPRSVILKLQRSDVPPSETRRNRSLLDHHRITTRRRNHVPMVQRCGIMLLWMIILMMMFHDHHTVTAFHVPSAISTRQIHNLLSPPPLRHYHCDGHDHPHHPRRYHHRPLHGRRHDNHANDDSRTSTRGTHRWYRRPFWNRVLPFTTPKFAPHPNPEDDMVPAVHPEHHHHNHHKDDSVILTAGMSTKGLVRALQTLHNPITYFVGGLVAGFRYDWCFRSPVYWFAIGFTIKWYRARYVFKIPVWDRQPNWNNIITSKEQEKDLKAFTCKNCGSTIFIAKTREFFFEGNTGIGGLGCFSCGARGKDNFIMDRERIVEDMGEMDDYFAYERPLDFVSRAERRQLLKEAQGDEEKANLLLLERTTGISSHTTDHASLEIVNAVVEDSSVDVNGMVRSTHLEETVVVDAAPTEEVPPLLLEATTTTTTVGADDVAGRDESRHEAMASNDVIVAPEPAWTSTTASPPLTTTVPAPKKPKSSLGLDGLDELDMDAW